MNKSLRYLTIVCLALIVPGLTLAACNVPIGGGDAPTATIISPATGGTVPVNEPVTVQVSGSDPDGAGVIRLDLQVDGITVDTFEAGGPQETVAAQLTFTPTTEGAVTVAVVAFRQDGTASDPASIALSVVGVTAESAQAGEAASGASSSSSGTGVRATANVQIIVRAKPGPGCAQLGVWPAGQTANLLERTVNADDPSIWWYKTDVLGANKLGYVYQGQEGANLKLSGPDDALPRVPEEGCGFCGDGQCSEALGEGCNACIEDCGTCPVCGDGAVNQSWEECDGGGCSAGYVCSGACECIPEPPVCGDSVVEGAEECDPPEAEPADPAPGDTVCWCDSTCYTLCKTTGVGPTLCGNGVVEGVEECDPPEAEPADPLPGVTVCWCDSSCSTLCKTTGVSPTLCGNGVVEGAEECDPPEAEPANPLPGVTVCWCDSSCTYLCKTSGVSPTVCGDGVVEGVEECDPPEAEPPDPAPGDIVCWCDNYCTTVCKVISP